MKLAILHHIATALSGPVPADQVDGYVGNVVASFIALMVRIKKRRMSLSGGNRLARCKYWFRSAVSASISFFAAAENLDPPIELVEMHRGRQAHPDPASLLT
jgi:hypothetical protein